LLPWIKQLAIEYKVSQVILLGDTTDRKDNHSSILVNKFIEQITDLANYVDCFVLKGNHDGIIEDLPYFNFIEHFKSNVTFISKITNYWLSLPTRQKSINCLFLPSTRKWQEDWQNIDFNQYDLVFTHQTYEGAKSETGISLDGIPPSFFANYRGKVYSGDVHVPQKLLSGRIEYVGAPYRIRFGDVFPPRILLIGDNLRTTNFTFDCLSKHVLLCSSVETLDEQVKLHKVKTNDQVKVRVKLSRQDLPTWKNLKDQIKHKAADEGWQLFGPELLPVNDGPVSVVKQTSVYKNSSQVLADFIQAKNLSGKQAEIGFSLIKS
jgi:ribosomal protein S10